MSNKPIEPQDYTCGVKVVQIEDIRVARGLTRRPASSCQHKSVVYDQAERRIWCKDCETDVEAFDAFVHLVTAYNRAVVNLDRRRSEIAETELFQIRSRAAKIMDQHWRSTTTVPLCPHCSTAILPEDVVNGLAKTSKKLALAARKRGESHER